MFVTGILTFFIAALTVFYLWMKNRHNYWKDKGIPFIKPDFIFGNVKDIFLFKKGPADGLEKLYHSEVAKDQPVVGMYAFHVPVLLVRDLDLIKKILIKDFTSFSNRFSGANPHADPLGSRVLFWIKNPAWRKLRASLTPVFTSGKMKQMFNLVENVGKELDEHLNSLTEKSPNNAMEMELKELCALFTTDVIASTALGIEANSIKNPNGEFRRAGKPIFHFSTYRAVEFNSLFFVPDVAKFLRFKLLSTASANFLRSSVEYVMKEREKAPKTRNDLIDTLLELRKASDNEKKEDAIVFDNETITAQAAQFFLAGFETSSATMSFALYEMARKPDTQKRLREEIREVLKKTDGKISYDTINEMKYLNMVLQEVLRLYPPLPFLDRVCTLPSGEKSYSLKPYSNFEIPNGMPVFIPIYAIQRDPKYFPNPEEFDPERFSPENKDNFPSLANMPFGTGPHNCIGERFGVMQAKIGLVYFLRNHKVEMCPRSHKKMELSKRAIIIQADGGIYCNVIRDPLIKV